MKKVTHPNVNTSYQHVDLALPSFSNQVHNIYVYMYMSTTIASSIYYT